MPYFAYNGHENVYYNFEGNLGLTVNRWNINRLKELREERGLTVRSLENLISINYSTITTYENDTRDLNTNALKKFATFFEVTIDYLLCYSGYYIFVNYHNLMFKVNEKDYKLLYKDGLV